MISSENAIRARRRLTNKIIAARQAERLKPFLDPQITVIVGDGGVISGAAAVLAAFNAQFQDPVFGAYLRTTESVSLNLDSSRAAETGAWIASSRPDSALISRGLYLACWRLSRGQWVIESELYVTLG